MANDKSQEVMSDDFENFLKTLRSMVYKTKKVERAEDTKSSRNEIVYTTTTPSIMLRRNENNEHRDAFGDMLMLKLVSYYENKYKVSYAELTTDTPSTPTVAVPTVEDTTKTSLRNLYNIQTTQGWYFDDQNYQNNIRNNVGAEVVII